MFGLSYTEVVLLGFLFTVFMVVISTVASYVGTRVGTRKDIASHESRLNKAEREIEDCVDEKHCDERRDVLSRNIERVENAIAENTKELRAAFTKLDGKLDKYILNNKR